MLICSFAAYFCAAYRMFSSSFMRNLHSRSGPSHWASSVNAKEKQFRPKYFLKHAFGSISTASGTVEEWPVSSEVRRWDNCSTLLFSSSVHPMFGPYMQRYCKDWFIWGFQMFSACMGWALIHAFQRRPPIRRQKNTHIESWATRRRRTDRDYLHVSRTSSKDTCAGVKNSVVSSISFLIKQDCSPGGITLQIALWWHHQTKVISVTQSPAACLWPLHMLSYTMRHVCG